MKVDFSPFLFALMLSVTSVKGMLIDISANISLITDIHNFYRRQEQAADMKELMWDKHLQSRAEQWSENCYFGHQRAGLGENLSSFWTNGPQFSLLYIVIQSCLSWWKEINDWTWSTDCEPACHYTQMIWSKSEKLGCALSKCTSLLNDFGQSTPNADFFVCFYDPPGNFIGQYPYVVGDRCSSCDSDETCHRGLCSKWSPQPITSLNRDMQSAEHSFIFN